MEKGPGKRPHRSNSAGPSKRFRGANHGGHKNGARSDNKNRRHGGPAGRSNFQNIRTPDGEGKFRTNIITDPKLKFKEKKLAKLLRPRGPAVKRHVPVEERKSLIGLSPRLRLHKLNSELAACASKKNLGEAIRVFRQLIAPTTTPTDVTYAALINAYVRAGETTKARWAYDAMQLEKQTIEAAMQQGKTLPPGISSGTLWLVPPRPIKHTVIILTTLLKGLATDGKIAEAWDLFKPHLQHTLDILLKGNEYVDSESGLLTLRARTINTFLRGCVRTGDVAAGWLVWQACTVTDIAAAKLLDAASVAAVVKILCQALMLDEADAVLAFYRKHRPEAFPQKGSKVKKDDDSDGASDSGIGAGNHDAEKAKGADSEICGGAAEKESQKDVRAVDFYTLTAEPFLDSAAAAVMLGFSDRADSALRKVDKILSIPQHFTAAESFLKHRHAEHRKTAGRLWYAVRQEGELSSIQPEAFRPLFFFGGDGSRVPLQELDSMAEKFGVAEQWSICRPRRIAGVAGSENSAKGIASLGWEVAGGTAKRTENDTELCSRIRQRKLRLTKTFTMKKRRFKERNICMEICAGAGDWVIAQAQKQKALWIASEIRHDRVHSIFQKSVNAGLSNLCILGGDGRFAINSLLPKRTVDCVYINFPEPPAYFDHPDHLLSNTFFMKLHRVLKRKGHIYIVSDNSDYLHLLAKSFIRLKEFYSFADGREGVIMGLPKGFGKRLSYFDRFWENGNRSSRGYIALKVKEDEEKQQSDEEKENSDISDE